MNSNTVSDLLLLNTNNPTNTKSNNTNTSNSNTNTNTRIEFSKKRKLEDEMRKNQQNLENNARKLKQQKLDERIDKLLNRNSSHATEEHHEWFDGLNKKMKSWESQEYMVNKENNETKDGVQLDGYYCSGCRRCHENESKSQLCKSRGHVLKSARLCKKYFECHSCLRKTSTL